jgi:hypothetical protein
MLEGSDGLLAETTNEALVEYLLAIRKPRQRLFLTVVNCLDGFGFDTDSWRTWYERGCDFHGYAWGTPPDWRPAPRFRDAVANFRDAFTRW